MSRWFFNVRDKQIGNTICCNIQDFYGLATLSNNMEKGRESERFA
ncbi:hypothetical protein [Bartonella sp. B10834G3]|nr:hypothetical protein [Bartonella sp. B10834G3]